jgi:CHAT domain-containing protein
MFKFKYLVVFATLLSLTISIIAQAQDTDFDKAKVLAAIKKQLTTADGNFQTKHWDTALADYQAALDQIRANKTNNAFDEKDKIELQTNEFRSLAGMGQSQFRIYFDKHVDSESSVLQAVRDRHKDPYIATWDSSDYNRDSFTQEQEAEVTKLLEEALDVGKSLPETLRGKETVYMYLGWVHAWVSNLSYPLDDAALIRDNRLVAAAAAFKSQNRPQMMATALYIRARLLGLSFPPDGFAGHPITYWYRQVIDSYREAALNGPRSIPMPGYTVVNPTNSPCFDYLDIAFRFTQQIENGTLKDATFDLNASLREQAQMATYLNLPHTTLTYRATANARLAWQLQTPALAQSAINDYVAYNNLKNSFGEGGLFNMLNPDNVKSAYLFEKHYLGRAYIQTNQRPDLALDYLDSSDQTAEAKGNSLDLWEALPPQYENDWLLGKTLTTLGRYREAIKRFNILQTRKGFDKSPLLPETMLDLSTLYQRLGMYSESIQPLKARLSYFEQALKEAPSGDAQIPVYQNKIIDTQLRLSLPLAILGRTEEALTGLQQAVDRAKALNDPVILLDTILRVGDIYLQLDSTDNALTAYQNAAVLAATAKLPRQAGRALLGVGQIQVSRNLLKEAAESLTQANKAAQTAKDAEGQVQALTALGDLAIKGDKPNAVAGFKLYQSALDIANKTDVRLSVKALLAIATLQMQSSPQTALVTYYRALSNAQAIDDREAIAQIYGHIGQLVGSTQPDLALRAYANAIDVVEQTQRGFRSESLTSQFAGNYAWIYADYVQLLVDQKRYDEAFLTIEKARSRAFLDQLAIGPLDLRKGSSADLLAKDTELRQNIEALQGLLTAAQSTTPADQDYVSRLRGLLRSAENEYTMLFTRMQAEDPTLTTLTAVEAASLQNIQADLDEKTTVLSYYTTESITYAFIITQGGASVVALKMDRSALADDVALFRADEKQASGLDKLSNVLISPIIAQIQTSRLVIVPHNSLNYLPFAALPLSDGQLLGEKFAISYLPSATSLLYLAKTPATVGKLLALGNPAADGFTPLPFAEEEVKQVASITGGEAVIGKDANEGLVWQRASDAGVLYFAAHGTLNLRNPLFSAVQLSAGTDTDADGHLTAYKIYRLDLTHSTELVVLSACETSVGKLSSGDEFTGLNRAFLYAGAPTVVATLWSVDDQATAILMETFFQSRAKGLANAEALQSAQAAVRTYTAKDGKMPYASPYYWAAFVLSGRG